MQQLKDLQKELIDWALGKKRKGVRPKTKQVKERLKTILSPTPRQKKLADLFKISELVAQG